MLAQTAVVSHGLLEHTVSAEGGGGEGARERGLGGEERGGRGGRGGDSEMLPIEDTSRVGTQLQVPASLKYVYVHTTMPYSTYSSNGVVKAPIYLPHWTCNLLPDTYVCRTVDHPQGRSRPNRCSCRNLQC